MKAYGGSGRIPRVLTQLQEEVNTQLCAQCLLLGEATSIPIGWAAKKAPKTFWGWQQYRKTQRRLGFKAWFKTLVSLVLEVLPGEHTYNYSARAENI
jgi:hypothetical protein